MFSIPLELRANWIFRVAPPPGVSRCLSATRRALYGLAVTPVWSAMAVLFFRLWPWRLAGAHIAILALLAIVFGDLFLAGFRKIPFTCAYLPGKSYFHMAFTCFLLFLFVLHHGAVLERSALETPFDI